MACLKCKTSNDNPMVFCDGCERSIHVECSELNASEMKVMALKNKRVLRYYCEDCLTGIRLVPKLIKKIDYIQGEIENLKNTTYRDTIDESSIQREINRIKESSYTTPDEIIIQELNEQQKRKNNVMIFNLPISENGDLWHAKNVIRTLIKQDLEITEVARVGKKNGNGLQALKVMFSSTTDAYKVIRANKDPIKGKKIFISADMTPRQISNLKKLKQELEERKKKGEEGISIKYIKGVPQIVPYRSKN